MKKIFIALALLAAIYNCAAQQKSETYVKVGDKVPEFTVEMFDGTKINIADLKGKVVVINFWATWCPPCQAELKRVQKEIIDEFAEEDFVFLPISREETKETVGKFREKNGYAFPMGLDYDGSIFKLFANTGIPRNFIIDREGKIASVEIGYDNDIFAKLISEIKHTLKNK